MKILRSALAAAALVLGGSSAWATSPSGAVSRTQMLTDITAMLPDNTQGRITPAIMRSVLNEMVNSTLFSLSNLSDVGVILTSLTSLNIQGLATLTTGNLVIGAASGSVASLALPAYSLVGTTTTTTTTHVQAGFLHSKDFGALGNNSADDTTALQNWINACEGTTAAHRCYLDEGIYRISSALVINSGIYLEGAGRNIAQISPTNATQDAFSITGSVPAGYIGKFNIVPVVTKTAGSSINMSNAGVITGWKLEDLLISGAYDGITVGNSYASYVIDDVYITCSHICINTAVTGDSSISNSVLLPGAGTGIQVVSGSGLKIVNTKILSVTSGSNGILWTGTNGCASCSDFAIANSSIEVAQSGISMTKGTATSMLNVSVIGGNINSANPINLGDTTAGWLGTIAISGVTVEPSGGVGITVAAAANFNISGNTITGSNAATTGISIGASATGCVLGSNQISGVTTPIVDSSAACSRTTGTVTSIATTGPITGGTITTTGTIGCATCGVTGNPLSQFAATTSAQLAGVISDETGSGLLVFNGSPAITSPTITGGTHVAITSLGVRDTSAAFDLTLAAVSSTALTAGRTLTIDVVNAARTLKLGANLTIATDPGGTTGALKSNGTGTFAQAACADLSNGAALCSSTDAANLTGTVASARLSGAYGGITGVGTLASGAVPTTLLTGALQAAQEPAHTGDVTNSAGSLALTLATVATAGTTGSSTAIPVITINVKGLTTSVTTAAVVAPAGTLTGSTLAAGVTASSLTSLGTITSLTATAINAFTLGGTIAGGGNQLNNVIIGTTTPLAGFFTTLSASTSVTSPVHYGGSAAGSTLDLDATSSGSPSGAIIRASVTTTPNFTLTSSQVTFNINAVTNPTPSVPGMELSAADTVSSGYAVDVYGPAAVGTNSFRAAGNTAASPSALTNGQNIGFFLWRGYDGSGAYSTTNQARIAVFTTEAWTDATHHGTAMSFSVTANATATQVEAGRFSNSGGFSVGTTTDAGIGALLANTSIKSQNATAGIGYATGAGGTVTQATSKSTTVVLNTVTGAITMNGAALAAGTIVSFTLTDSAIGATDVLVLNHISGGTVGSYTLNAQAASGSATINIRNNTGGSLSDAVVIEFAVIKGVTAELLNRDVNPANDNTPTFMEHVA